MYYVNVPVSLSYEADKNGGEVAVCGGEISFCFHRKKTCPHLITNAGTFKLKHGHVLNKRGVIL